ncbi:MAG TPA: hypothetical protein PLG20_09225 [Candidatus Syntrophosphaera sp.]|nr:hypothetical protein [Candidatus Syntrophosphaera sp.]
MAQEDPPDTAVGHRIGIGFVKPDFFNGAHLVDLRFCVYLLRIGISRRSSDWEIINLACAGTDGHRNSPKT